MTRYFFDLYDGKKIILEDKRGWDLLNISEAREWAAVLTVSTEAHVTTLAEPHDPREFRVHKAVGGCLATIAFRYVAI